MSTHDLDLALDMDRVLVVESGRVVFDGGAAAAVDRYRELCAAGLAAVPRRGEPAAHVRGEQVSGQASCSQTMSRAIR